MINCPRCKLPQVKTHQCEYCGLIYEKHARSIRSKTALLLVAVLMAVGVVFFSYHHLSPKTGPIEQPAVTENSNESALTTTDEKLKKTARELSGDAGLIGRLTGGLSKGSVIAMVFFSIVGIGYFTYGKKSRQLLMVICGIALLLYSFFVNGTVNIVLIGVGLSVLPFLVGILATKSK